MAKVTILNTLKTRQTRKVNTGDDYTDTGAIIYRGPSEIDGSPIVVIATYKKSLNGKTGNMIQTWILREDISPVDAVKTGKDSSICGDCSHRGDSEMERGRSCYVTVFQAPRSVWDTVRRNRYRTLTEASDISALGEGRKVRLGSYGDPAAVPAYVWLALLSRSDRKRTGYSHQWRNADSEYSTFLMASVDTPAQYAEAKAKGWRTFRVKAAEQPILENEIVCPASKEAGYKSSCDRCGLCAGNYSSSKRDIVINAHGSKGKIKLAEIIARSNA